MKNVTELYTSDGRHPEDVIHEFKTFINKLSEVQDDYYEKLCKSLNLNSEGENLLFDYIYNVNNQEQQVDDFVDYLENLNKDYEDFINK